MLNKFKRGIAALLSLILLIGAIQLPVFATTEESEMHIHEDAVQEERIVDEEIDGLDETVTETISYNDVDETADIVFVTADQVKPEPAKRTVHPNLVAFSKYYLKKLAACPEYIDVSSYKFKASELNSIYNEIFYKMPEAFNIESLGHTTDSTGTYIQRIYMWYRSFADTASEYTECYNKMMQGAETLLAGVDWDSLSDVNKALLLHDRLALWAEYDYDNAYPKTEKRQIFTAYAILGERLGVCQGYSMAYMYLLDRVGIESGYVRSDAIWHGWNIVYINGVGYHVDVTWDADHREGRIYHNNFLISSSAAIANGHIGDGAATVDWEIYTNYSNTNFTNNTFDNYYWKESNAEFQYIGGKIYYINTAEEMLYVIEGNNHKALFSVAGKWYYKEDAQGRWYHDEQAKLASVGSKLLINTDKTIVAYDVVSGNKITVYTPASLGEFENIYGFKYENGKIICDIASHPDYSKPLRQISVSYTPTCDRHSYTVSVSTTPATCTSNAKTTYRCAFCTQTETRNSGPALGHSFTNYKSNGNATCTADGTKTAKCDRCSVTDTVTDTGSMLGHSYTVYVSGTPATCTTAGTATYKCSRCTSTRKDPAGAALGHSFTKYVSNSDATCQKDGTKTAKCDRCTATNTVTDIGSKTDHKWNSGVHTDATADKEGYTTYTCVWCGTTKVVVDVVQAQITGHPASVTTDSGNTVTFTVKTKGTVKSCQWQYRKLYKWYDTSLTGYNTNTLTVSATGARNGYDYRCVVTFKDGTVLESDPAKLTVNTVITLTGHPKDQTISLGNKGQFTAAASGESIQYQWQYKRPGSEKWIDTSMEGATKATVLIETTASRNGYQYRCKITDITGNEAFTSAATLQVLSIKKHPAAVDAEANKTVKFMVETSVSNGFTYQWQYSKDGETWSNTTMTGYNTATLEVVATAARNGYLYRCVITDARNGKLISCSAKLTIKTAEVTPEAEPAKITTQPKSATAVANSDIKFTVKATGAVAYRWYYSKDGTVWNETTMTGYNTAMLTVNAAASRDGYRYRCVVTGEDGAKVNSYAATLRVAQITEQPENSYGFVDGNVKFTTKLSVTSNITYQWQYRKSSTGAWTNTSLTGYNTKTLTVGVLSTRNGYEYRCVIKDAFNNTLISDTATLHTLTVDQQPVSKTAVLDGNAVFSVTVNQPDAVTYQWFYSKDGGTKWYETGMTGYNTKALTVGATDVRNGYLYRCKLTDSSGNIVHTEGATLNILSVTGQPADAAAQVGEKVQFTVQVNNAEGLIYQWQYSKNGGEKWYSTTMEGYNTATLTVEATAARDGYQYRCVIKLADGTSMITNGATLTVTVPEPVVPVEPLTINTQPKNACALLGGNSLFAVKATGAVSYKWQYRRSETANWTNTSMAGYNTDTLTVGVTAARNGYQYRCIITGEDGSAVNTSAATLTVVTVEEQPTTGYGFIGSTTKFTVKLSETTGIKYQWQYRRSETGNWTNTTMTGYNTKTLTVDVTAARSSYQYRCKLTDSFGNALESEFAAIGIVKITQQPVDKTVKVGDICEFIVVTTNPEIMGYQWQYRRSETGNWTNTTMDGYDTDLLCVDATSGRNGYQYRCILKLENGSTLESDFATLTVG